LLILNYCGRFGFRHIQKQEIIMKKVNAFENEIFDHYRTRVKEIGKSINLLKSHGYTVVDLEGKIIENEVKLTE